MNILYVVSRPLEINTSASIRNRATIDGLIELGHNIDLITTEPDENHTNYDASIKNDNVKTTYIKLGGVQTAAKVGRRFKFLKPIKNMLYKYMSRVDIYDNLKSITNHVSKVDVKDGYYDIIISSSDPKSSHLFISEMFEKKILHKTPWIQIWGDPFLSDITRKNNKLNNRIKKEEDRLLKYATKVIYVSQLTLLEQKNIYPHHAEKMKYVPIPYVKEEIYPSVDLKKESLTFLYCGDYSSKVRNIKPLYEAIEKSNHKLIVCGNSDLELESTERIKMYPRVSFDKTKEFEKNCDVLVHLSNLSGTQIPGKIYQYSGTNKPILFILDGENNLIRKTFEIYKRFLFMDNKSENLKDEILNIGNKFDIEYLKPVKQFSSSVISKKIIEEMEG